MLTYILERSRWDGRRRQWQPTPVLLPGKSHGRRSLVGCSPWGHTESDTTEQLHFHFSLSCIGEGNGNPLQCSCLENPRDGEPNGLPSMEPHRVGHDWGDLAAAAADEMVRLDYFACCQFDNGFCSFCHSWIFYYPLSSCLTTFTVPCLAPILYVSLGPICLSDAFVQIYSTRL